MGLPRLHPPPGARPGGQPSLPDPRIKAIVLLSASDYMLKVSELARVRVPALILGEEWDSLVNAFPPNPRFESQHARTHAAFSGHPNYRVDITGANHHSFADTCNAMILLEARGIPTTLDAWRASFVLPPFPRPRPGRSSPAICSRS